MARNVSGRRSSSSWRIVHCSRSSSERRSPRSSGRRPSRLLGARATGVAAAATRALAATRSATPCSQLPTDSRRPIDPALRARTRNVACDASLRPPRHPAPAGRRANHRSVTIDQRVNAASAVSSPRWTNRSSNWPSVSPTAVPVRNRDSICLKSGISEPVDRRQIATVTDRRILNVVPGRPSIIPRRRRVFHGPPHDTAEFATGTTSPAGPPHVVSGTESARPEWPDDTMIVRRRSRTGILCSFMRGGV